jgi:hypothetical protein
LLAAVGVVPGLILSVVPGYFLIEHEQETLTKPVAPKFLHDVMNALTSKGQVKG